MGQSDDTQWCCSGDDRIGICLDMNMRYSVQWSDCDYPRVLRCCCGCQVEDIFNKPGVSFTILWYSSQSSWLWYRSSYPAQAEHIIQPETRERRSFHRTGWLTIPLATDTPLVYRIVFHPQQLSTLHCFGALSLIYVYLISPLEEEVAELTFTHMQRSWAGMWWNEWKGFSWLVCQFYLVGWDGDPLLWHVSLGSFNIIEFQSRPPEREYVWYGD